MMRVDARYVSFAALTLAVISLAINVFLVVKLREAEQMLSPARSFVEQLRTGDGTMRTEIRLPAGIPINLDVPIDERVVVRVDTILPINTRVVVPIRSPLGNYDVPVPIRANVPLRANLPLRFQHTLRLRSQTPEDVTVPIEVDIPR